MYLLLNVKSASMKLNVVVVGNIARATPTVCQEFAHYHQISLWNQTQKGQYSLVVGKIPKLFS